MTFKQNQVITALPNVLRDQTLPNTLAGVGDPATVARRRVSPVAPLAVGAAVLAAGLAALLVVGARIG